MIFDVSQRTDASPMRNAETGFGFLNRSARPEIGVVREFLEVCLSGYPSEEVPELVSRLRSGNDGQFDSATFEIILHAGLTKLGYTLIPHPPLPNGCTSRPDFLVRTPDGQQLYLEAVLASEKTEKKPAGEALIGLAVDAIAKASHRDFFVALESRGYPQTQPSGKKLLRDTLAWLDTLSVDEIARIAEQSGLDACPSYTWRHEEWELTIRPVPISPERRGTSSTLLGILSGGASWVDAFSPLRNAIKRKGSKYGTLDAPLLIAVNVQSFDLDPIDEKQALFGQEQVVFSRNDPDMTPRFQRAPNGVWIGPKGPQYKRISGVWFFNDLNPYTVASRRQTIYWNPWTAHPLPESLLVFPHFKAAEAKAQRVDGIEFRQIFDLPEDWPEDAGPQ